MDQELQNEVDRLRADFSSVRGRPFKHFYCPILRTDEPADLCKGHLTPTALRSSTVWIPQRADVDNFYGTATEASFVSVVANKSKHPVEFLLSSLLSRVFRPNLELGGRTFEHYFPTNETIPSCHTEVSIVNQSGTARRVAIKASPDSLKPFDGEELQIVVNQDFRPPVVASLIKSAHLTLFRAFGYTHVFSPGGMFVADILGQFFLKSRGLKTKALHAAIAKYFAPFTRMVCPLLSAGGTLINPSEVDNSFLALVTAKDEVFTIGVVVSAGPDRFCVFALLTRVTRSTPT